MAYDKSWQTLRVTDAYNRTKVKKVELKSLDAAQAELDGDNVHTAYQNAMAGFIGSAIVSGEKIYAGAPTAGSNVDTGVTIQCQLSGRPEKASLKWPTPLPDYINVDGSVDIADPLVAAISALYEAGVGQVAYLSDGESISGFVSGSLDK